MNSTADMEDCPATAKMLQMLVEGALHTAIFLLDKQGFVKTWNKGAERIKGWSAYDVVGRHFSIFYTDEDRESGMPAKVLQAAEQFGKFEAEGWRLRKDGTRFFASVSVEPIYDEHGHFVAFAKIVRDITHRYLAQAKLAEAEGMLRQSQKMEAVGKLAGGLAHDLNNLLAVITGSAELALLRSRDADLHRYVRRIIDTADRGAYLVKQLLSVARRQPLHPRKVDTATVLTDIVEMLRHTIRKNITVVANIQPVPWIMIDPADLRASIVNLATNAEDAMPLGGNLRISASVLDDGMVEVRVDDSGTGISEEMLARVTEPFFTTKDPGKGSGLGLSQAYAFAQQSGGWLSIESSVGVGTSVRLAFPPAAPDEPETEDAPPLPEPPAGRPSILVVDDDAEVGATVAELLTESGYQVTQATSAADALAAFERGERFDLVFSDVVMPGMSGPEMVAEIGARGIDVPVLLCSGYTRGAPIDTRGHPLLVKPYPMAEMLEAVRSAIERAKSSFRESSG